MSKLPSGMCSVLPRLQEPNPEVLQAVSHMLSVSRDHRVCTGVYPLGLLQGECAAVEGRLYIV